MPCSHFYIVLKFYIHKYVYENQASEGIKKQRSRKTQIHKMNPVFIEFYHFPLEIILFTYDPNEVFLRTFKHFKIFIFPHFFRLKCIKAT